MYGERAMTMPDDFDYLDLETIKKSLDRKKIFLGDLVLKNFQCLGHKEKNLFGGEYWIKFRERPEKTLEIIEKLEEYENNVHL